MFPSYGHTTVGTYASTTSSINELIEATPLIRAVRSGRLELVKILVDNGADVNKGAFMDGSPLIEASKLGYLDIAKYLVQNGADVNIHVETDETPLIQAAWKGHLDIVKFLIKEGADVNKTVRGGFKINSEKRNALRMAIQGKHIDVINYLKLKGAKK